MGRRRLGCGWFASAVWSGRQHFFFLLRIAMKVWLRCCRVLCAWMLGIVLLKFKAWRQMLLWRSRRLLRLLEAKV
ncbi:MAG: hypothetical protein ACKERG_04560 [Candidatus Hodgkinia cicadicola]